jgi:hypothetical protein
MSGKDVPGDGGATLQRAEWVDSDAPAEEARIGAPRLVRGGATVSAATEDSPAPRDGPESSGRLLGEAEIAESGLLQERVIEIGEMREEAVVSKQAVVREELVVRKDVEERTERIADTLRRPEVDVERLEPETAAEGEDSEAAPPR